MTISRRNLLATSALLPAAGCAWFQKVADTDMSKVAADIGVISGAVTAVKNTVSSIGLIPAKVKSEVIAAIDSAVSGAHRAVTAVSKVASQPFVLQVEDSLKAALEYGKGLLPKDMAGLLSDALLVLSAVKNVIGILPLIPMAGDPKAVDDARMRLQAAAATVRR